MTSLRWWQRPAALDLRSLALFRIGLAVIILVDLLGRFADLEAHYTDAGVLPRRIAIAEGNAWFVSLYFAFGHPVGVTLLFAVQALVAVGLLVGYRTRLMVVLSWLLQISLQARNVAILSSENAVLRILLLWAIFLPLGARWAVDSALAPTPEEAAADDELRDDGPPPLVLANLATLALVLQAILLYLSAGVQKYSRGGDAWQNGTAVYYAVQMQELANPWFGWLAERLWLCRVIGEATLALELFVPLLLLLPWAWARFTAIVSFVAFHIGTVLLFWLGILPWICIVMWVALLPSGFYELGAVRWLGDRLRGYDPTDWLRERMDRRGRSWRPSWLSQLIVGLLASAGVMWNIHHLQARPINIRIPFTSTTWLLSPQPPRLNDDFRRFGYVIRLDQGWAMFASVRRRTGWVIPVGQLGDGRKVDLRTGDPLDPDAASEPQLAPSDRWKTYLKALPRKRYEQHRELYLAYCIRQYLERQPPGSQRRGGPTRLRRVYLQYHEQRLAPPGEPRPAPTTRVLPSSTFRPLFRRSKGKAELTQLRSP